jgi:hypothetical protein
MADSGLGLALNGKDSSIKTNDTHGYREVTQPSAFRQGLRSRVCVLSLTDMNRAELC